MQFKILVEIKYGLFSSLVKTTSAQLAPITMKCGKIDYLK